MASQPPQPPESIIISDFKGVKNTVSRERLQPGELASAVNIDLDDTGMARRRRGYTLKLAGDFHSLRRVGDRILAVKDGELGDVNTNYTFTSLGVDGGVEPIAYTAVGETIYYGSLDVSGKITGTAVSPWGVSADAGRWISPVMTPTETLGAVFGKLLKAPPMAEHLASYSGRIYLAAGPYLWATELYLYDYVDRTKNFLQFESDITMLWAMNDGLYVGTTTALYFLKGTLSGGLKQDQCCSVGVIRGSAVEVAARDVHPDARQGNVPDTPAVVFLIADGVCAGFDGGQVFNLTAGKVVFPDAQTAAALYRSDSGVSSYLAVMDSAGGPAANARIGDYVDAEIVRLGGS